MNVRLPIVILAGAACAFLLPLPPAAAPSAPVAERPAAPLLPAAAPGFSTLEAAAPALDPDTIARMERAACIAALDRFLRRHAGVPSAEEQQSALALTARIFRSAGAQEEADFPGGRKLPAWLLASSWLALAKDSAGVPVALRRALPAMPAGLDAAVRIVESLAATDAGAARDFAQSMPRDWRRSLREARLSGLAAVHPLEAARQMWQTERPVMGRLALAAARGGPAEETVRMLAEFRDDIGETSVATALALLHARDAAALQKLVTAQGDAKLTEQLAEVARRPDPWQYAGHPLEEVLTAAAKNPGARSAAVRAIEQSALHDPGAATASWSALPDGPLKKETGEGLLNSLARHHPAAALAWSEEHAPQASLLAVRDWLSADAPAALRAILELPYSSILRQQAVEELNGGSQNHLRLLPAAGLAREDLFMAAQELPANLRRQVLSE